MTTLNKNRIEFFDTLRCLAIVPVLFHHAYSPSLPGGYLGVYLFFPISGFLIVLSLESQSTTKFYIRRLFRIYTPLVAVLVVWAIMSLVYKVRVDNVSDVVAALVDNLLVLEVHRSEGYSLGVLWTLHAEIWFYILAPWLLIPVRNGWKRGREIQTGILILLAVLSFMVRERYIQMPSNPLWVLSSVFDCFVVGMILAIWRNELHGFKCSFFNKFGFCFAFVSIIAFYFMESKDTWFRSEIALATSAMCCVIIACSIRENIRLDNPLFKWVGVTSYSMYLIHGLILDFRLLVPLRNFFSEIGVYKVLNLFEISARMDDFGNRAFLFVFALLVSTLLLHYLAEKPGMKLGYRLSK